MKIGFRASINETGELYIDPEHYQSEITDISGKMLRIRLLKGTLSNKLKTGIFLSLELPNRFASVAIQEIKFEAGWIILHCKSRGAFPAIVIGQPSLSAANKYV